MKRLLRWWRAEMHVVKWRVRVNGVVVGEGWSWGQRRANEAMDRALPSVGTMYE